VRRVGRGVRRKREGREEGEEESQGMNEGGERSEHEGRRERSLRASWTVCPS